MVMEIRVVQQGDNRKSSTFAAESIVYMHLIHNLEMAEMLLNRETVCLLSHSENPYTGSISISSD